MSRVLGVPMPPAVEGIPTPGPAEVELIVAWSQRGHRHGFTHGRPLGRLVSLVMWCATAVLRPLMAAHYLRMLTRPDTRFYWSPDEDCILGVQASTAGWAIVDHIAAHPGRGSGRRLRTKVLPALAKAADAAGVAITTTAVNKKMATAYATDLPGLLPVPRWFPINRAFPRGRRLRRAPQPTGGAPSSSTRLP